MISSGVFVFPASRPLPIAFYEHHGGCCLMALKTIACGLQCDGLGNSLKKNEKALHHQGREHILFNP